MNCIACDYPIAHDDALGWLHLDRPDGRSFDHRAMVNLFQQGDFTFASGIRSSWKVECDALVESDWETIAAELARMIPRRFGRVIGVPRGGLPLARALEAYVDESSRDVLVADDVWTTGGSMRPYMASYGLSLGAVVFAHTRPPANVIALFVKGNL